MPVPLFIENLANPLLDSVKADLTNIQALSSLTDRDYEAKLYEKQGGVDSITSIIAHMINDLPQASADYKNNVDSADLEDMVRALLRATTAGAKYTDNELTTRMQTYIAEILNDPTSCIGELEKLQATMATLESEITRRLDVIRDAPAPLNRSQSTPNLPSSNTSATPPPEPTPPPAPPPAQLSRPKSAPSLPSGSSRAMVGGGGRSLDIEKVLTSITGRMQVENAKLNELTHDVQLADLAKNPQKNAPKANQIIKAHKTLHDTYDKISDHITNLNNALVTLQTDKDETRKARNGPKIKAMTEALAAAHKESDLTKSNIERIEPLVVKMEKTLAARPTTAPARRLDEDEKPAPTPRAHSSPH